MGSIIQKDLGSGGFAGNLTIRQANFEALLVMIFDAIWKLYYLHLPTIRNPKQIDNHIYYAYRKISQLTWQ